MEVEGKRARPITVHVNYSVLRHRMLVSSERRLLVFGACRDQFVTLLFGALLLVVSGGCIGGAQEVKKADAAVPASQTFTLSDTKDLVVEPGVKAEAVEYRGRKAVRLTREAVDQSAMALVNGTDFRDGTIEVDVATKVTTPPGGRRPGFTGVAFRVGDDAAHYELFYLRPGNSSAEDQAMRNHAVQFVSAPGFGWEKLRRQWPFIYESWADLKLDEWTKVKIDVRGRVAKLYVNGSDKPSLIVDGLKGDGLQGAVGLCVEYGRGGVLFEAADQQCEAGGSGEWR